ncbi:MAG: hypothetical protein Q4G62_06305 [Pseudomonadota bacterium]|nr:hypothetical protein [Pseudomonadota bacterium]
MPETMIDGYLRERLCARQWRGFLQAMGREFESALDADDLALLMGRIGARFADANALPAADDLDAVEAACNAIWSAIDWGWCELDEQDSHVLIRHVCAPLNAAIDADWADGFLLGVYGRWFQQLGMLPGLGIKRLRSASPDVRHLALQRVS